MSPNLQRYLRSISASHPNSGAASQARPPVPAPLRHPAPIPPPATIIGKSLSATLHTHWHSIQPLSLAHHNQPRPLAPDPRHARALRKAAPYFPYFTTQPALLGAAAQTDLLAVHHARHHRRPSGMASSSRATASSKTIINTSKPHVGHSEDHHEWHHQAARRHRRSPSRMAPSRSTTSSRATSAQQDIMDVRAAGEEIISDLTIGAAEAEEVDPTNRIYLHWMGGRVSLYERQTTRPTL